MKIEGYSNLKKTESGAVVNTDRSAYLAAKERKKDKQKIHDLEERLNRMEELLKGLIEK